MYSTKTLQKNGPPVAFIILFSDDALILNSITTHIFQEQIQPIFFHIKKTQKDQAETKKGRKVAVNRALNSKKQKQTKKYFFKNYKHIYCLIRTSCMNNLVQKTQRKKLQNELTYDANI